MDFNEFEEAVKMLNRHGPSFTPQPVRDQAFLRIGRFLEDAVRPGRPYDLALNPNPVWMTIEQRLLRALDEIEHIQISDHEIRLWQMYNSGVIIRSGDVNIGLDTIPMLRSFNWPEPDGLTERMAELLDMLLITHHHPDHYDRRLVAECLKRDKPVFMPESLAREWEDAPTLYPAHGGMQEEQNDHLITARHALHVWREAIEDVPLVYYEITGPQEYTLLFSGDADYTRTFCKTPGISVDLLFLPWRNPNARYEEGHAEQTGTTLDAVRVAVDTIQPKAILLEHYAELEHIYQDYPASYDIALNLKKQLDTTPCDWLFWGESILLHP